MATIVDLLPNIRLAVGFGHLDTIVIFVRDFELVTVAPAVAAHGSVLPRVVMPLQ